MKQPDSPWVVIFMAHGEGRAERAREALSNEGFMVRLRPVAQSLATGERCVEIMVLPSEAQEARDLLTELQI